MPTYQYACTSQACGLRFERVQAFTDPAISECPECSDRVRKVYGSVGVVFKGSGFYRTDSRDAKKGAKASSDGSAAEAGKGTGSGKADAGSGAGKADSGSGSAGSGESKSAAATKPAATVAS
jgi:putative FmdB family regulatory protein